MLLGRFLDLGPWAVNLVSFSYHISPFFAKYLFIIIGFVSRNFPLCIKIVAKCSSGSEANLNLYLG